MESKVRVRYFSEWNDKEPGILFSADPKSVKKLEDLFRQLAFGQIKKIEFNSLDFIEPFFDIKIVAFVGEKDEGMVKEEDILEWIVSDSKWEDYADLLSVFQDGKAEHQYLDVWDNCNSIEVQVSVNEYPSEWIGWKEY